MLWSSTKNSHLKSKHHIISFIVLKRITLQKEAFFYWNIRISIKRDWPGCHCLFDEVDFILGFETALKQAMILTISVYNLL
jgi:hypothetical protein